MLQALLQTLQPHTRLSVSSGLTLASGRTHSASIKQWRQALRDQTPMGPDNHQPAVFALGR